jgi:hypothetical protein
MKTDLRAKPVTIIKNDNKEYFNTRDEASLSLFNKIDKEALDNLMRNPTSEVKAFYTFTEDYVEFRSRIESLMFLNQ